MTMHARIEPDCPAADSFDGGRRAGEPSAPLPGAPQPLGQTGPLSEKDFILVRQAANRRVGIARCAGRAKVSSNITLIIGFLALVLVPVWPSWDGAMIAVGLCVVGFVERFGAGRMRQADPGAARLLGSNQLALLGLIVLYCLIQMITFSSERAKAEVISPETRSQLNGMPEITRSLDATIERWAPLANYGFYGLVIVLSAVFQGGMAVYYFARRRQLAEFHSQTPPWISRLFVEAGA
jgi:hypothetical protein